MAVVWRNMIMAPGSTIRKLEDLGQLTDFQKSIVHLAHISIAWITQ